MNNATPIERTTDAFLYKDLNETEKRIVDGWVASGVSLKKALKWLEDDLHDAAVEDGYDGP